MSLVTHGFNKTTVQLYRDCFRLANHVASNSPKGRAIKASIRSSFKKHKDESDPQTIENLRGNAIRALANYLVAESGLKDSRIKASINKYSSFEAQMASENTAPPT